VINTYLQSGKELEITSQHPRWISLGKDAATQTPYHLPAAQLVGQNIGVFGDSETGKSWVTGLLVEGLHLSGYQTLIIDLEGDYRGMSILPRVVALDGTLETLTAPDVVVTLLAETELSVVLDLSAYPVAQREDYVSALFQMLGPLKKQQFRPHWMLLEEAQQCLSRPDNELSKALIPLLEFGGCGLVSYRPDRLGDNVLDTLNLCLLLRLTSPEAIQAVRQVFDMPPTTLLSDIPDKHTLLDGERLLTLPPEARRVEHVRHLHKYLDVPLPRHKRFYFRDEQGYLALEAGSLSEFKEILGYLPQESIVYHCNRGDFVAWTQHALNDAELAAHIHDISQASLDGDTLRKALQVQVAARLEELLARH
jgi:hypothetical protein